MVKKFFASSLTFQEVFYVSIGTIPGVLLRWILDDYFWVNILGSLILGIIFGLQINRRNQIIFGVGFCGASTTFSSWIVDIFHFLVDGDIYNAFSLLFTSLFFSLFAVTLGFRLGRRINRFNYPS